MSEFEFIIGIFTIVLGLGTTHILTTLADTLKHRSTITHYWVYTAWLVVMQFSLIGYWYGAWRGMHELEEFPFLLFLAAFVFNAIIPYLACRLLSVDIAAEPGLDLHAYFQRIRVPFFVCFGLPMIQGLVADGPFGYAPSATATLDIVISLEFIVVILVGTLSRSDRVHAALVVLHALFYLITEVQQVQVGF